MIVLVNDEYSLEKAKELFPPSAEYRLVQETDKELRKTRQAIVDAGEECVIYKTVKTLEFKPKNYCFLTETNRKHLTGH